MTRTPVVEPCQTGVTFTVEAIDSTAGVVKYLRPSAGQMR